jgi:hypothetical protein
MHSESTPAVMRLRPSAFINRFTFHLGFVALFALSMASLKAADTWVQAVTKSAPKYWYRFEETDPTQAAVSQGSATGWDGLYGAGITAAELGKPSAIADLGKAVAFTEPADGTATEKFVDLAANSADPDAGIPELINVRPAADGTDKSTSVEYWIKTAQKGSVDTQTWNSPSLLAHESPGDGDMYWGWINDAGDFGFSTSDFAEIFEQRDGGPKAINVTDNNWHHIVLVKEWHATTPSVSTMYIDGGSAAGGSTITKTTVTGSASYQDPDGGIRYLGFTQNGGGTDLQYIGLFDELAIYDRALPASEVAAHFNAVATAVDTDGDGMPDVWEIAHGLDPATNDASADPDNDGLSNLKEYQAKTDPHNPDSDGDGLKDNVETNTGIWVSATDTGTDPNNPDTDGDGLPDAVETNTGTVVGPNNTGSNPNKADTDGDGFNDWVEFKSGSNPSSSASLPPPGWVSAVAASIPKYWYRFNETDPTAPAVNDGLANGWNGTYGPEMTAADNLGKPSILPSLGKALEFTGPTAGNGTGKFVDLAVNATNPDGGIPELINLRPPAVDETTTVEYWVKTGQRGSVDSQTWNSPALLAHESGGDGDMYWGWITDTGEFGLSTSDITEIYSGRDGGKAVTDNNWHHIVLTKEWHVSSPCVSTMYIDGGSGQGGATIIKNTAAGNTSYQDADGGIRYLGFTQNGGGTDVQYIGLVDELAIYDRGLTDTEVAAHYNAVVKLDSDGDGMPDMYEIAHNLNPAVNDANGDPDNDGLSNLKEYQAGTDPQNADTDGDGLKDGVETNTGKYVSASDTGTDPLKADTDGDGLPDAVETNTGVFVSQTNTGTSPFLKDTDGDSYDDLGEVKVGSNPNDKTSLPPPGTWVDAVTKAAPKYWYRFNETDPATPAKNSGSAGAAWDGLYGPGITAADLGQTAPIAGLGTALQFSGPPADNTTGKFVDVASHSATPDDGIPELNNYRPPTVDKTTTVEYWMRTSQSGSADTQTWNSPSIMAHESPGDGDMYWGFINDTGDFAFSTSDIVEIMSQRDGGRDFTDGQWHLVVLIKEWHANQPSVSTMYVDGGANQGGITVVKNTPAGNPSYQDTDSGIRYVGFTQNGGGGDVQYIGLLDELAIYDRALTETEVRQHYRSVFEADSDGDGMPDAWELANGLNPNVNDAAGDADSDGSTNLAEFQNHTDPKNPDSDGDGLKDGVETNTGVWVSATNTGTNPLDADTDNDGLSDGVETNTGVFVDANNTGTNPLKTDTDADTFSDSVELANGTNPNDAKSPAISSWVDAVKADQPLYWWRFENTTAAAGVPNEGSVAGFTGTFGPEIKDADLNKPSATGLGHALEFTGPPAGTGTGKFVDFGESIPELVNLRSAPEEGKSTTVEYWVKTTQKGSADNQTWNSPAIFGRESPADGDMYWGWFTDTGRFGFSTSDLVELYADGVTDGNWHHIVLVKIWHETDPCISRMFVDGGAFGGGQTLQTTTAAGSPSEQDDDSLIQFLGFDPNGGGTDLQYIGLIDEVAIYNKAFDEFRAHVHYLAAKGLPVSSFKITAISVDNGVNLTWEATAGASYKVQRSTTLTPGSWQDVGTVNATGPTATFKDTAPPASYAFYRVSRS